MATTSRSARYAKWLSIPLGLVISALLIWQASYAAFSDTTSTTGSWMAGSVDITEGPADLGDFDAENLAPGGPWETTTMEATYTGSLDADVSFYGTGFSSEPAALAEFIELRITAIPDGPAGLPGVGGEHTFFEGKLKDFATAHHNFASGWTSPVAVPNGYGAELRIDYRLSSDAADKSLENGRVNLTFVGEAKSRPSGN